MAEEIIDLRDRIEKMRIEIENETIQQVSNEEPLEIRHKTNNSNISLSFKKKQYEPNQVSEKISDNENLKNIGDKNNKVSSKNETFPAVSLSVKNPVSSKIIIFMVLLQIISNIGILYFLYLGME